MLCLFNLSENRKASKQIQMRSRRFTDYHYGIEWNINRKAYNRLRSVLLEKYHRTLILYGKINVFCFRRVKHVVLGTKKDQLGFSERQKQVINSSNNI